MKKNKNPWETLRGFWNTCSKHQTYNQSPLNNSIMQNVLFDSVNFQCYVAAVEMATHLSKGDGDPNKYDHLAKDLYREGYLEALNDLPEWKKNVFRSYWEQEVVRLANLMYSES